MQVKIEINKENELILNEKMNIFFVKNDVISYINENNIDKILFDPQQFSFRDKNDSGFQCLEKMLQSCPNIKSINLRWSVVSNEGVEILSEIIEKTDAKITSLTINSWITDKGCVFLAKIHSLKELYLWGNSITSQGAKLLTALQHLETIALDGTYLDHSGVMALCSMPGLKKISFKTTPAWKILQNDPELVKRLSERGPLEFFNLSRNIDVQIGCNIYLKPRVDNEEPKRTSAFELFLYLDTEQENGVIYYPVNKAPVKYVDKTIHDLFNQPEIINDKGKILLRKIEKNVKESLLDLVKKTGENLHTTPATVKPATLFPSLKALTLFAAKKNNLSLPDFYPLELKEQVEKTDLNARDQLPVVTKVYHN